MSLLGLPMLIARKLVHIVTGGGQEPPPPPRPADAWERRGLGEELPVSEGSESSPPEDRGHSHDHGHIHGHSHDHDHGASS